MNVTMAPEAAAANDSLSARADERLTHAYEQIARADEQLARLTEQLARMEQDGAEQPPAVLRRRRSRGRPALRGLVGLLAAACIIGTALASQSSYGEAAKPAIARLVAPYVAPVSWLAQAKPDAAAQPSGIQLASVETASPTATTSAQARPQDAASPAAVATTAEVMQQLQAVARDLATVQQGIDQLRAGQEQLASDNARAAEQFKASQEQMTRLVARVSEQEQRAAKPAPPALRPVAEPARKPVPVQASSQARAAPPLQLQPAPR